MVEVREDDDERNPCAWHTSTRKPEMNKSRAFMVGVVMDVVMKASSM